MVSRMGLSILSSLGLSHLCVDNTADYQMRVKDIAQLTGAQYQELRDKILHSNKQVHLASEIEALIQPLSDGLRKA